MEIYTFPQGVSNVDFRKNEIKSTVFVTPTKREECVSLFLMIPD
jgi:hypothetical protein